MALWPQRSGGRPLLNIPRTLNISPLGNCSPSLTQIGGISCIRGGGGGLRWESRGMCVLVLCARRRRRNLLDEHANRLRDFQSACVIGLGNLFPLEQHDYCAWQQFRLEDLGLSDATLGQECGNKHGQPPDGRERQGLRPRRWPDRAIVAVC